MRRGNAFLICCMAVLIGSLLCGCVSSRRAMRLSPLSGEMPDSGAVNLWPFYQQSGSSGSVLWPLADFDARGVAIRPLFVKDGEEYSVLFPLSAWNRYDGWVANVYWLDSGKSFGMLPLWECTWGEFYAVVPFWYYKLSGNWGMFPLIWRFPDRMNVFAPVWWNEGAVGSWGVFPLVWWCPERVNVFGPVWWVPRTYRVSWGVFPLVWRYPNRLNVFGPIWWSEGFPRSWGLFPLVWRGSGHFNLLGPVWWNEDAVTGNWGVFPLVWRNPDRLNIFGPVWWNENAASGSWGVFPLFWKMRTGHALFPLYYYDSQGEENTWELNVLGPVFDLEIKKGEMRRLACLWPLLIWDEKSLICWPFYSDSPSFDTPFLFYGRYRNGQLPEGSELPGWGSRPKRDEVTCCFGLWHSKFEEERYFEADSAGVENTLGYLAHLLEVSSLDEVEKGKKIQELLQQLKIDHPVPENAEERDSLRELLLERYVYEREEYNSGLLFGLFWNDQTARFRKYGGEWTPWERSASVLGGLYRVRDNGEARQTSVFPFISIYEEPGKSGWNFAAGMFGRETAGEETTVRIFFFSY